MGGVAHAESEYGLNEPGIQSGFRLVLVVVLLGFSYWAAQKQDRRLLLICGAVSTVLSLIWVVLPLVGYRRGLAGDLVLAGLGVALVGYFLVSLMRRRHGK